MTDGVLNVYKEKGYTSHDVVARLRGIFKQRKIGHTGTLDPEAEGVLPVCLGKATKLCDMLTDKRKEYVADFVLGITTDTQDMTGNVLSMSRAETAPDKIEEAVMSFLGSYEQLPPMYSAVKVNGKRLYELAREGREVERSKRPVTIYELEILELEPPSVRIRVVCSKGTYIRTLCHDIGARLSCGAAVKTLLRTRVERFTLENAKTLSQIEEAVKKGETRGLVLPVDEMFGELAAVTVKEDFYKAALNGNPLFLRAVTGKSGWLEGERARLYDREGRFYGIYEFQAMKGRFKPVKLFL